MLNGFVKQFYNEGSSAARFVSDLVTSFLVRTATSHIYDRSEGAVVTHLICVSIHKT